ncbi:MAG: anti-sigma factor family protein [Jiangellaceae bacterium]
MKHLGVLVTALVDDQLGHDDRDRALAHVAGCAECRAEVERERQTKSLLRRLPDVPPPAELVQALLTMAEPGGPLPPERRPFPGAAAPTARWRARDTRSGTTRPGSGRPGGIAGPGRVRRPEGAPRLNRDPKRVRLLATGALSAGALTLVLATLGGPAASGSAPATIVPPVEQFTVEHARSTGSLPFVGPAAVLVPAGVAGSGP